VCRELEWKTPIFFERVVPNAPNALIGELLVVGSSGVLRGADGRAMRGPQCQYISHPILVHMEIPIWTKHGGAE
jgi:hypothetical protein